MSEIDQAHFRTVLGHFPTGVTVVASVDGDEPVGMAIGSFFSVSLEPPLVGFCPAKSSSSWARISSVGSFCANILAADQEDVCRVFASSGEDKFASIGWERAASGSPRLDGVLAWIDCSIEAVHDAGDHDLVVGRVIELDTARSGNPLVFFRGGYADLA